MGLEVANDNLAELSEHAAGVGTMTDATAVVCLGIGEWLRFLSHAETLRVFERACARAGLPVKFSQGFNPHPRLSLPLPRPVGVAADDELLVLRLFEDAGFPLGAERASERLAWQDRMRQRLAETLVPGLEVRQVHLVKSSVSLHPISAEYVLTVASTDRWKDKIAGIVASSELVIERLVPNRPGGRRVDVRPYILAMRHDATRVMIECGITEAGSIRVDEIMTLLGMTHADLAAPIRRTRVAWKIA